jgi:Zn-dependent protease
VDLIAERFAGWVVLAFSLCVHEWAHAAAANALGDDTARLQGRLSWDPLVHLHPVGSVLFPLVGIPFGWAIPVPVEPLRFRPGITQARGLLLTAAAGPVSNLVLWLIFASAAPLVPPTSALHFLLERGVSINIALCVGNLLPIPPLDGSRVLEGLLPFAWRAHWARFVVLGPYGLGLVLLILLLW